MATKTIDHRDTFGNPYKLKYTVDVDGVSLIPIVDASGGSDLVRGGHIMARCATGTTELLPAPPAGYLNAISAATIKNAHASSALTYRFTDADGAFWGPATDSQAAGTSAISALLRPLWIGDSAVSVIVSGTGTPVEILAEWHQIIKPNGWAVGVVALTNAYQNIPNMIPASNMARPWSALLSPEAQSIPNNFVWNGDSAAVQLQYRLIRDGVTFDWNAGAGAGVAVAAFTNGQIAASLVLLPGDQLLAKVASIGIPGAAILRHFAETMVAP